MKWAAAWKYLPVNYGTNIGSVENTLQKTWFRNNLKGEKIRLKFTNKYGVSPLILDRVMISGEKDTDQRVQVTCRGNTLCGGYVVGEVLSYCVPFV